jgi:phage terminase large subunit-like protein
VPVLRSGSELSKLELAIIGMGGPERFFAWWNSIEDEGHKMRLAYDWYWRARPKQLPPDGDWSTWICRCGRGWGKTLTGAEWIRMRVEMQGARNIALVAPTAADVRDVMVEGPSGILAISPPWFRPEYEPSKRRVTWPNGAMATTFSADEPRSLRGPQYDTAWCDELAHWRYLDDSWDNLQFGLRMRDARCLVTSSPRPLKFLRDLEADPESITVIGSTYENSGNLPKKYLAKLKRRYDGTRLGRQEIFAEILTDNPNALWVQKRIDDLRVAGLPADFIRVVVAVDPATTAKKKSDETGIVASHVVPPAASHGCS